MAHGVTTKSTYNWWFQLRYLSQHGRGKFFRYRAISAMFGFDHTGKSLTYLRRRYLHSETVAGTVTVRHLEKLRSKCTKSWRSPSSQGLRILQQFLHPRRQMVCIVSSPEFFLQVHSFFLISIIPCLQL